MERRQIAHTLLNAVYLDADRGPVVAIAPKPEFAPLFALAAEGLTGATAGDTVILAPGDELEQVPGTCERAGHLDAAH